MKHHEMKLQIVVREVVKNGQEGYEVNIEGRGATPEMLAFAIDSLIEQFKHIYCVEEENE